MTTETDAILRRIRGLLAKAEGTDNPHEAEAFSAKAFEMMERHRIDLAEVRGAEATIVRAEYPLAAKAKYLRPSSALLSVVAEHYGVVVMIASTGNRRVVTMVGDQDDITATVLMFESLVIQRDRAILASTAPPWTNVNKFRSSAADGFAHRMHQRLRDLRDARKASAMASGSTTALALVDRGDAVRAALGNPSRVNENRRSLDRDGARAGIDAANRADLGLDRIDHPTGPRALNR